MKSLQRLRFQPGDRRIESLSCEEWHGHAGFAKLAWDDVLQKHKKFIEDVKSGAFL